MAALYNQTDEQSKIEMDYKFHFLIGEEFASAPERNLQARAGAARQWRRGLAAPERRASASTRSS
jgi:hypothetical protein